MEQGSNSILWNRGVIQITQYLLHYYMEQGSNSILQNRGVKNMKFLAKISISNFSFLNFFFFINKKMITDYHFLCFGGFVLSFESTYNGCWYTVTGPDVCIHYSKIHLYFVLYYRVCFRYIAASWLTGSFFGRTSSREMKQMALTSISNLFRWV